MQRDYSLMCGGEVGFVPKGSGPDPLYLFPYIPCALSWVLTLQAPTMDEDFHLVLGLLEFFCCCLTVFLFCFVLFLGPHPQHVEVPRIGVEFGAVAYSLNLSHSKARSELYLPPTPQPLDP